MTRLDVERTRDARARGMLARAFLSQNVAIGCAFGAFGVSVIPIQERFGSTRAEASMGLALVILMIGLLSPAVAGAIVRFGLRATMIVGAVLSGSGYLAVALAPSTLAVLLAYGLLIGPGVAMFGPLSSSMLAGGWFSERRGRAVGVANMSLFVALLPLIGLGIIDRFGLPPFFISLAGLHLLLLPVLAGVADPPVLAPTSTDAEPQPAAPLVTAKTLLARPLFWLMALAAGFLNAAGIVAAAHMVALQIEKGLTPGFATLLVSLMGGASMLGSVAVGLLCDRLGGARTLALAGLGFALSWAVVLTTNWLPLLVPAMLLIGACGAGVFPAVNVLGAHLYGGASLPRVVGYFNLLTLPVAFLLPPAAGALRDATGGYAAVMLSIVVGCTAVAIIFVAIGNREARVSHKQSNTAEPAR